LFEAAVIRRIDVLRLARSALLLGLGLVIAKLLATGQMHYYLSPGLDPLSALTGALLTGMGGLELRTALQARAGDSAGPVEMDLVLTLGVLAVPLLLGLTYTPHGLSSGALGGTPASQLVLAFDNGPPSPDAAPPVPRHTIEDVADLLGYLRQAGQAGVGQQVHLRGLVAHDADLASDEFVLLRYSIVHCVADAQPLGFLVLNATQPDGGWKSDQWVEIDGVLATQPRGGDRLVAIQAHQIRSSEEPLEPYVSAY
jgi:uncharacterized repeat protein (TIGR03943 family)